jgi:phosphoglycerate kinase
VKTGFCPSAYLCNGGELDAIPHIQSLRKFPKEELAAKVVMVRFDSTVLLREELDQQTRSVSSALFTIKYLYEAGAKVILVSDWSITINSKLVLAESVAGNI